MGADMACNMGAENMLCAYHTVENALANFFSKAAVENRCLGHNENKRGGRAQAELFLGRG